MNKYYSITCEPISNLRHLSYSPDILRSFLVKTKKKKKNKVIQRKEKYCHVFDGEIFSFVSALRTHPLFVTPSTLVPSADRTPRTRLPTPLAHTITFLINSSGNYEPNSSKMVM